MSEATSSAVIEVTASYPPFAALYGASAPTIQIDDDRYRRPWGVSTFRVPAGTHEVAVSYPYLFWRECGRRSVFVHVRAGDTRRVSYQPSAIRFIRGRIEVDGV